MPNGKPGDHPLTDILNYGQTVYGPEIDDLVRKIASFASRRELDEWWTADIGWLPTIGTDEIMRRARLKLTELEDRARQGGWEAGNR